MNCSVQDYSSLSTSAYAALTDSQKALGCRTFGALPGSFAATATASCVVADEIPCLGAHQFVKSNFPCIKYEGYSFPVVLLCSLFVGFLGADRFVMGHTCVGVVKLLSLGGLGIWWGIDLALLSAGMLAPLDGSSYNLFF